MADQNVHITFGPDFRDHAVLLLAAAEELELGPSVVATTDHGFSVPAEVAKKAGVKPDGDESEPEPEKPKPAKKAAAKKATTPRKAAAKKTAAAPTSKE